MFHCRRLFYSLVLHTNLVTELIPARSNPGRSVALPDKPILSLMPSVFKIQPSWKHKLSWILHYTFILYINDLPRAFKLTEPLFFADDTSIFFLHSNPSYLENVLNNELLNINVWLKCNKLSINVQKTNYVIFRPSQRKVNHIFFSLLWRVSL